jgi:hypothetical protein
MERLHVTRAYARGVQRRSRCMLYPASHSAAGADPLPSGEPGKPNLF